MRAEAARLEADAESAGLEAVAAESVAVEAAPEVEDLAGTWARHLAAVVAEPEPEVVEDVI